jgi:hypothetical protein
MIRADDDGFVANQKKILRMVGCNEDDIKILANKGFVIPVVVPSNSGLIVITHWNVHNYIRPDRYSETIYKEEKSMLELNNGSYQLSYQMDPQVRLGKDSIGKVKKNPPNPPGGTTKDFLEFYAAYPKKQAKADALKAFKATKDLPPVSEIVSAVGRWKRSEQWTRDGGQFIPLPATWIRQRRWEDELNVKIESKTDDAEIIAAQARRERERLRLVAEKGDAQFPALKWGDA